MIDRINWGILGAGTIASKFTQGLSILDDAKLTAVGSRSYERAKEFADQFGIPKAYGNYNDLVADPDVDVIYIASPVSEHYKHILLCLEHGKAVLCEKSFTVNAAQARHVVQIARQKKLFLMEAMWTRFLPSTSKVCEWLQSGIIGEVRMVTASLGFHMDWIPEGLIFNLRLAGGSLLSVGVYSVSFASMVFNTPPAKIESIAHFGKTQVDEQFTALFGYEGGKMASLFSSICTPTKPDGYIYGTKGYIHLPKFFAPRSAELFVEGREVERYAKEFLGNGYNYEAAEVNRCMREGKVESRIMPLDETLAVMKTMDDIRSLWSFKYSFEQENLYIVEKIKN